MNGKIVKSIIGLSLAAVVTATSFVPAYAMAGAPKTPPRDYTGYLLDAHCAAKGVDDETGKINLKLNPEKHTTSCLKIDMCMMSGLGISIKEGKEYKFYAFDKTGSKKADDTIMMMTKRKFGHKIAIKGTLDKTTMTITAIKEAK